MANAVITPELLAQLQLMASNNASGTNNTTSSGASNNGSNERVQSQLLMAVGELKEGAPSPDSPDFDPKEHLTNFPQMFGVDTMLRDSRKASTSEFAAKRDDSNDFLDDSVEELMAKTKPGDIVVAKHLVVTFYRRKEEAQAPERTTRRKRRSLID